MRNVLVALLLALAASTAFADPPDEDVHRPHIVHDAGYYLQFDMGFNLSFLNGNTYARLPLPNEGSGEFFKSGTGLGLLLGATLGYEFSPRFALSLRLDYDSRHIAKSGTVNDTCSYYDPFNKDVIAVNKDLAVTADYLSLSLLANYRFDKLYIFAGPNYGSPLGVDVTETDQILDTSAACSFFTPSPDPVKRVSGTLDVSNARRFSLKFGAGYLIPLTSTISLVPQLAYDLQLSNTIDQNWTNGLADDPGFATHETVVNGAMRLSALQATIGLRVNL